MNNGDYRMDLNDPLLIYTPITSSSSLSYTTQVNSITENINNNNSHPNSLSNSFASPSILRIVSKPISKCLIATIYIFSLLNLIFSTIFYIYPLYYKVLIPSLVVILIIHLFSVTKQIH